MTTYADLPDSSDADYRWAGTTLVSEEQFRIEEWHLYRGTEWRPTPAGIQRYAQLKASRRATRKSQWRAIQERDAEYSESVNQLIADRDV